MTKIEDKKQEHQDKKHDAEHQLKIFKEHGVEEKLQKQVDFDKDAQKCRRVVDYVGQYLADLESFLDKHEDELKNQQIYTSRFNKDFFKEFFAIFGKLLEVFDNVKKECADSTAIYKELKEKAGEFEKKREGMKEQFAEIERELAAQLKTSSESSIKLDEFKQLRKTVDFSSQVLENLKKQESKRKDIQNHLLRSLTELNELWHEEFQTIESELEQVNRNHPALQIECKYKGDKNAFLSFMKEMFRGSNIRENTFRKFVENYADFGAIYKNFEKAKDIAGNSSTVFEKYFSDNLADLLTWQPPNQFVIKYRGKELKQHSLGQRASALILFVLSQQENDVIIIDQPEDDLDNQTIYEDVIKLLREMKPQMQFIFATHNANLPVLGDAEQVFACTYSEDAVDLECGSIDCPNMQQKIVDIMEGGKEAFKRRKEIYEIWKPRI